jgi:hypothetical protein
MEVAPMEVAAMEVAAMVMHMEVTVVAMVTRPIMANPQYFYLRRREGGGREVQGREDSWDICERVITYACRKVSSKGYCVMEECGTSLVFLKFVQKI